MTRGQGFVSSHWPVIGCWGKDGKDGTLGDTATLVEGDYLGVATGQQILGV